MKISVAFLFLLMVSVVSANGLTIVGNNSFDIEKEEGVPIEFQITIQNADSFSFHNIGLDGEGIATMTTIGQLDSGQSINATVRVNGDEPFDGKLKIVGEYEAQLGASNITEVVEIDYDNGVDKCDMQLIKGDSITWKNNGLDKIRLKDINTDEYFVEILDQENQTRLFSEPMTLEYVAVWIVPFTEICTIEVLDDEGLVHNSDYDAEIDLKLDINYVETSIETTFLSTSYSLDYNQEKSNEYFSIRNTGSSIARVQISGEWILFEESSLNIGAGESVNIEYSISPAVMQTNQTNKTYIKNITIEGNFPTLEEEISVYVKYANLDEIIGGDTLSEEWFNNMVDLGCIAYPENEKCRRTISYYNSSGGKIEITEESFRLFLEKYGEDSIERDKQRKAELELDINTTTTLKKIEDKLGVVENETKTTNADKERKGDVSLFLIISLAFIVVMAILVNLILKERKKKRVKKGLGISGGELQ